MSILSKDRIILHARAADRDDAIRQAGGLLVKGGCVLPPYIDGMLAREQSMSTSLGVGVAIPHGIYENKEHILMTALSVVQLVEPVDWGDGDMVNLVIGIAASSDEHVGVLANLAEVIEEEEILAELLTTDDPDYILKHLDATRAEAE